MVHLANDPAGLPAPPWATAEPVTEVITAAKRTKAQRAAAAVITTDARCTPVLVRAAIVGRARMPRAALEIRAPDGSVIGHVALPNTSRSFDLQQRFWLVGDPTPGSVVALVSEHRTQVILPGSPLKAGPAVGQEWSGLACRMLGWERTALARDAPAGFHTVFADQRRSVDSPEFAKAVDRFRFAAVTVPLIFFGFCFPFLFVIPMLVQRGYTPVVLLILPVLGGGLMTLWSAYCRKELGVEAELIEAGAARWDKEIAFTQSYWASMRRPSVPWDGPLPDAAR